MYTEELKGRIQHWFCSFFHVLSDINQLVFNTNVFKITCENFTTIGAHVFKKKTKNC